MEEPKYIDSEQKAKTTRSITLEILVQEQKLKLKRGGKNKFRTGSGEELRY